MGKVVIIQETMDAILQSWVILGWLSANVTDRESPSRMTEDRFSERVKRAANKAAVASPIGAEQGGLIIEDHWTIEPVESLQTAAWVEKECQIAVS
jgi:hypothetical protein